MYKKNQSLPLKDQIITSFPEIMEYELNPEDEFMVLGCDGIWEVKTNQEVVDFVRERLPIAKAQGKPLSWVAGEFLDATLSPDITSTEGLGCDNMTMLIVEFEKPKLETYLKSQADKAGNIKNYWA